MPLKIGRLPIDGEELTGMQLVLMHIRYLTFTRKLQF